MLLKNLRISFPHLWVPDAYEEGQKPKYSVNILIPKHGDPQLKKIQREIKRLIDTTDWIKGKKPLPKNICLLDGDDEKSDTDGYEGMMYINAKNASRPSVFDRVKDPDTGRPVVLTEDDGRPYGGCYCNISVEFWAQNVPKYAARIGCGLAGVQFWRDGERFGGTAPSKSGDFEYLDEDELDALEDDYEDDEEEEDEEMEDWLK